MTNDVINAVKRLQRAGDENSRVTQKLREATEKVAGLVETQIPECLYGVQLPRGYVVEQHRNNVYLRCRPVAIACDDYTGESYSDRFDLYPGSGCVPPPRQVLLDFAKDIAEGWLDEVAAVIEEANVKAEQAADAIERHVG